MGVADGVGGWQESGVNPAGEGEVGSMVHELSRTATSETFIT